MRIEKEELILFSDNKVKKPLYAHQKFVLNHDDWDQLKIHVPTSAGKTLCAVLFGLKEKYDNPSKMVKTLLIYPTNLLSQNQFEKSIIRGLTDWIGANKREQKLLNPVKRQLIPGWNGFFNECAGGAPTIVFDLPAKLGSEKLWLTILNGEILFRMFTEENKIELGEKKGKYLFNILDVLSQRNHIILTSPDLIGYIAQQCYSMSAGWYNQRWKDDLSVFLWGHRAVVDEYHFYDPYTYINVEKTLEKLNIEKILLLSATKKAFYFKNASLLSIQDLETDFNNDQVDTHIASYPIDIDLIDDELKIRDCCPELETIYFFNSVVVAHELAEQLRKKGICLTEWTGIQKTQNSVNKLIIATSAAEVGLDLQLYEMHTEFWGLDTEIPSLVQRIGRIGRFKSDYPFKAFIHIGNSQQPYVLKKIFNEHETISKDKFTELLYEAYGETPFDPTNFVSHYLWDEEQKQRLREEWGIIDSKISFHFRPPQSQAVFKWNNHIFVYNKFPIENQYHIELIKKYTDIPFWKSFGLSEYEVKEKKSKDERSWKKPYVGKLYPLHDSKKWFVYTSEDKNII
ncbi:MAG: helicase-related protein [Candidatus Thermoplasmatota archaeon]